MKSQVALLEERLERIGERSKSDVSEIQCLQTSVTDRFDGIDIDDIGNDGGESRESRNGHKNSKQKKREKSFSPGRSYDRSQTRFKQGQLIPMDPEYKLAFRVNYFFYIIYFIIILNCRYEYRICILYFYNNRKKYSELQSNLHITIHA